MPTDSRKWQRTGCAPKREAVSRQSEVEFHLAITATEFCKRRIARDEKLSTGLSFLHSGLWQRTVSGDS
jgi:hypothetical protein